jgi:hypothetical protein
VSVVKLLSGQENKAGDKVLAKTVTGQALPLESLSLSGECRDSMWHGLCNVNRTLITF